MRGMTIRPRTRFLLALIFTLNAPAQAPLTPPGPPAPSMKALDQIESRTPVPDPSGAPGFPISLNSSGSYYLTQNLTVASGDAIVINADNVSLDLNGYTIGSTAPSASGIAIRIASGRSQLAISNGHIRSGSTASGGVFNAGPGFQSGISCPSGTGPVNVRVSQVSVSGVTLFGIDLGTDPSSVAQACTVRVSGLIGLRAGSVSDCSSTLGNNIAISAATVLNSVGSLVSGGGNGITTNGPTLEAIQGRADPRTPIATVPYTIASPGSYYLAQNLSVSSGDAIVIAADDVSLDLNGYTISSTANPAAGAAIAIANTRSNIQISKGQIRGTATLSGITFSGGGFLNGITGLSITAVRISDLSLRAIRGNGINLTAGSSGTVARCALQVISGHAIVVATSVSDCALVQGGGIGVDAQTVTNCYMQTISFSEHAIKGTTVENCTGLTNGGRGVQAVVAKNSTGYSDTGAGLFASAVASGCYGYSQNNTGLKTDNLAIHCVGQSQFNTGLEAYIANSSRGTSSTATGQVVNFKYNMP